MESKGLIWKGRWKDTSRDKSLGFHPESLDDHTWCSCLVTPDTAQRERHNEVGRSKEPKVADRRKYLGRRGN